MRVPFTIAHLTMVLSLALVAFIVFDRSSYEAAAGQTAKEAFHKAFYIGLAASGTLSLTFFNPSHFSEDALDWGSWFLRVILGFVTLALVSYGAATKGVAHGGKRRSGIRS